MGLRKWGLVAAFVSIYAVVCAAGVMASICAPAYGDGDRVEASGLGSPTRLAVVEGEPGHPGTLSLYFDEAVDDLALVTVSRDSPAVEAGSRPLQFAPVDGLTGTVRAAAVERDLLVEDGGAWRLTLVAPETSGGSLGQLSLCTGTGVAGFAVAYNYCLPLVQGVYCAIAAYGFLLYRSKRERRLLMFSLYALFLFLWGLGSFLERSLWLDVPVAGTFTALLYGISAAYGIATCACFCRFDRRGGGAARWWYMPLVAGIALGLLTDVAPPLFDSMLVIAIYMAGGVVLLAVSDGSRRLPRAVLFGLSFSQGLRSVFLICTLLALAPPIQLEVMRQMHLLAMPYAVGCLIDIGSAFSRRFKEAEAQAVELALINEELDRRVDERTRELVRQQDLRASILANLFHDCKTPLSILRGAVVRVREDPTCRAGQIEVIESQVANLTDIVDELFAVVKLQDNALLMDTEPVPLAPMLRDIAMSCAVEAAGRAIEISCSCASAPVAWGDEMWLGRAFQNIVANAVNFSKPGGTVEIGLSDDGETARVTVADHGAGIDPADIDKVFDRYYRTAKERTSSQSSGLGLSIARGVVERHGGSISVESELGRGTVFTVTLPVWAEQEEGDGAR